MNLKRIWIASLSFVLILLMAGHGMAVVSIDTNVFNITGTSSTLTAGYTIFDTNKTATESGTIKYIKLNTSGIAGNFKLVSFQDNGSAYIFKNESINYSLSAGGNIQIIPVDFYISSGEILGIYSAKTTLYLTSGVISTIKYISGYTNTSKVYASWSSAANGEYLYGAWGDYNQTLIDKSVVAPYASLSIGAGNWGSSSITKEYFIDHHQYRIRQTGNITNISLFIDNKRTLSDFRLTFWRDNTSGGMDRIGTSENIANNISSDQINYINLSTSIPVIEGDYYGYILNSTSNSILYATSNSNGFTNYTNFELSGANLTGYDWRNLTNYSASSATVVTIQMYMSSPYAVFIGDSITGGFPYHYSYITTTNTNNTSATIEYQWYNLTRKSYQNMGIGSQTTTQIQARYISDVVNLTPQFAIIEGGVNDVSNGIVSNETILANYEQMITDSENASITPVVILILPWTNGNNSQSQRIDYINSQLILKKNNHSSLIIVDARQEVGSFRAGGDADNYWNISTPYNSGDNVHFNSAGHLEIAETIRLSFIDLYGNISHNISSDRALLYNKSVVGNTKLNASIIPSSDSITVNVTTYNSTLINFTATNSTSDQTMNISLGNDTFQVLNGHSYYITKDNVQQQLSIATSNYVNFTNISVGSNYTVEEYIFTSSNQIISCPVGWCFLAMNYTNKTLLEIDNNYTTDTVQSLFNSTSQKYETHRIRYTPNQNSNVTQKQGYSIYFITATNVNINLTSNPTISLKLGWNLVGNMDTNRSLSTLKTSIGATATSASHFNNTLQSWQTADAEIVNVGESFMVYVNANTDWSG